MQPSKSHVLLSNPENRHELLQAKFQSHNCSLVGGVGIVVATATVLEAAAVVAIGTVDTADVANALSLEATSTPDDCLVFDRVFDCAASTNSASVVVATASAAAAAILGVAIVAAAALPLTTLGFRPRLGFGSKTTSPPSVVSGADLAPLFAIITMFLMEK